MITLGLSEVQVGVASSEGKMPSDVKKIGKTYKDTAKMSQEKSEVTEHYEEGRSAPEHRSKQKKIPVFVFSMMDPDVDVLVNYIGGEKIVSETGGKDQWGFNGDEKVKNQAIRIKSEQGFWFDMPNADIEATINAEMSKKGIFLVDFEITPCAVTAGKAIYGYPGE